MKNKEKKMTAKMFKEVEIEIAHISCDLGVLSWEDGELDGEMDDDEFPRMPCVDANSFTEDFQWHLEIDPKTGRIENWEKGHTASVCYKVCDECVIVYRTSFGDDYKYEGCVPDFLCPKEDGYGDYVIMDIDEEGYIQNWGARNALQLDFEDDDLEEL